MASNRGCLWENWKWLESRRSTEERGRLDLNDNQDDSTVGGNNNAIKPEEGNGDSETGTVADDYQSINSLNIFQGKSKVAIFLQMLSKLKYFFSQHVSEFLKQVQLNKVYSVEMFQIKILKFRLNCDLQFSVTSVG